VFSTPAQGPSLFLCNVDIEKVVTAILNPAHYTTNVSLTPFCCQNNVQNGHHFVLILEDVFQRRLNIPAAHSARVGDVNRQHGVIARQ